MVQSEHGTQPCGVSIRTSSGLRTWNSQRLSWTRMMRWKQLGQLLQQLLQQLLCSGRLQQQRDRGWQGCCRDSFVEWILPHGVGDKR